MQDLTERFHGHNGLTERAMNQAARELFLAQSSDWAFIMHTGTMVPYAVRRTKEHLRNFNSLYEGLTSGGVHEDWLSRLEGAHNIFPEMRHQVFSKTKGEL